MVRSLRASIALLCFGAAVAAVPTRHVEAQGVARITGVVIDETTRQPVAGANVSVRGTAYGSSTDTQGRYTVTGVRPGLYSIDVRRIGFGQATVSNVSIVADSTYTINFALKSSPLQLEQVVVTGSGEETQQLKVPYTVAKVTAAEMPVMPNMSAAGAIAGKVSGAQVIRARGPGAGVYVQLRTPTSQFGSNSPMWIVDGVILSSTISGTTVDIDNMDIAEIEVLKGAAATALYGSRASGGVVSIKTNRGLDASFGQTLVTVNSEMGFAKVSDLPARPRTHWFRVNDQGQYIDAQGNVTERGRRIASVDNMQDNAYIDPLYDQVGALFRPGQFKSQRIDVQQNSASTNFTVSFSQYNEEGVVKNNRGFERQNVRLNLDHRIRNNLSFVTSVTHVRSSRDPNEVTFTDFSRFLPDVDLTQVDSLGVPVIFPDNWEKRVNPFYRQYRLDQDDRRVRTLLSAQTRFSPLSWLSFDGNVSYDRADNNSSWFIPRGILGTDGETPEVGTYRVDEQRSSTLNMSGGVRFNHSFGDLSVTASSLVQQEREVNNEDYGRGDDFTVGGVKRIDVAKTRIAGSWFSDRRANRYTQSMNLDYAERYNMELAWTREGSSLFGPEARWNDFGRVGVSYNVSREPWFPTAMSDIFSQLRFRYGFGRGGSRPAFGDRFETVEITGGGGVTRQSLGNALLRPEIATEHEYGVDMIVKDRYSAQLVYYDRLNDDNIIGVPVPALYGFNTQERNVGSTTGRGFEATLQIPVIVNPGRGFNWDLQLIGDHSSHRIASFNRSCYTDGSLWRCGDTRLSEIWGNRLIDGIDQLPGGVPAEMHNQFQINDEGFVVWVGEGNRWTEGMSKNLWGTFTTIDGVRYDWGRPILQRDSLGVIENMRIGDYNADFRGSIRNTFRWNGFRLYSLLSGQVGGQIYNNVRQGDLTVLRHSENDQSAKPDSLKKPTQYYSASTGVTAANGRWMQNFLEDGTFLKLAELQLSYAVPPRYLSPFQRVGLEQATISLSGRNLYTWTSYSGVDPDVGSSSIRRLDDYGYPTYRNYTMSLNLKF